MRFTLQQLQCFVTAARHEYFGDAARALQLSPSAFSDQIANLEEKIGEALFTRTNRGARITARGAELLPLATQVIHSVERFEAEIVKRTEVITLASMNTVPEVAQILRSLRAEFPQAELKTQHVPYLDGVPKLFAGDLDALIYPMPHKNNPPGTDYVVIQQQGFVAAMPKKHPLAQRASVTLNDLLPYELLSVTDLERDVWHTGIFGAERVPFLKRKPLIIDAPQAQDLVAAGFGINVCPESMQYSNPRDEVTYIPISDAPTLYMGLLTLAEDRRPIMNVLRKFAAQAH
ncbi:LysR family transcriptional regulator [Micrococcoides hystricis]|uniref:LysR family transcriptional regulator n=1 Tax=Micrococcoides hystricis TaxID=1572761 RepID=A0ABV6P6T9_9MICC